MSTPLVGLAAEFYSLILQIDGGNRTARHRVKDTKKRNGGAPAEWMAAVRHFVERHGRIAYNFDEEAGNFQSVLRGAIGEGRVVPAAVVPQDGGDTAAVAATPVALIPRAIAAPVPTVAGAPAFVPGSMNHPFTKLAGAWRAFDHDERAFELGRAVDSIGLCVGTDHLVPPVIAWLRHHVDPSHLAERLGLAAAPASMEAALTEAVGRFGDDALAEVVGSWLAANPGAREALIAAVVPAPQGEPTTEESDADRLERALAVVRAANLTPKQVGVLLGWPSEMVVEAAPPADAPPPAAPASGRRVRS